MDVITDHAGIKVDISERTLVNKADIDSRTWNTTKPLQWVMMSAMAS